MGRNLGNWDSGKKVIAPFQLVFFLSQFYVMYDCQIVINYHLSIQSILSTKELRLFFLKSEMGCRSINCNCQAPGPGLDQPGP